MTQPEADNERTTIGREGYRDPTALVLALCLGILGVLFVNSKTRGTYGVDFYSYWAFGQAVAEGTTGGNLYSSEASAAIAREFMGRVTASGSGGAQKAAQWNAKMYKDGLEPVSTPLYYAVFSAFVSRDYDRDLWRFQVTSNVLLLLSLVMLCRVLGYGWAATALLIALVSFAFNPLNTDLEAANANRIQCALVVLSTLLCCRSSSRGGWVFAGFVLACVVFFKPNIALLPVLLAGMWVLNQRYEKLTFGVVGLLLGSAVSLGFSAYQFGTVRCWLDWIDALRRAHLVTQPIEHFNLSTARLIYSWTETDVSVPLTLALVASFLVCAWRGRRVEVVPQGNSPRDRLRALEEDLSAAGAGAVVPLIAAQRVWDHYYLLALPLTVYLLRPNAPGRWTSARLSVATVGFLLCGAASIALVMPNLQFGQLILWVSIGSAILWGLLLGQVAAKGR